MKFSGPRFTLPIATIDIHEVRKLIVGYAATGSLVTTTGDRVPITITIPTDIADIRPKDRLTLYTEIPTHADTYTTSIQ